MENGSINSENKVVRYRRIILTAVVLLTFFIWNTEGFLPKPWGVPAMIMVPLVITIGMFERETAGMLFGLGAGLLLDAFSVQTVCFHSVMLTAAGYFSGVLITRLMRNNLKTCLLFNVIFIPFYNTLFYFVNYFSLSRNEVEYVYFNIYLASVIYTMIFVPLIYWIIRAVFRKSSKQI